MAINQLPDGLRSIIGWVVGCCTKIIHHLPEQENPFQSPFVLILDEPECNLHPAWQRKILPAIQKLFINAQIIVATHSPFMISSVNEGYVHVMKFNENDEVIIEEAKVCSKGDSYIDVLEELMGVKEWFDPETEELLQNFRDKRDTGVPLQDLELLARNIADRGEYLAEMMGREMAQLRRKAASNKAS